jgi:hypothetical protein
MAIYVENVLLTSVFSSYSPWTFFTYVTAEGSAGLVPSGPTVYQVGFNPGNNSVQIDVNGYPNSTGLQMIVTGYELRDGTKKREVIFTN